MNFNLTVQAYAGSSEKERQLFKLEVGGSSPSPRAILFISMVSEVKK